MVCIIPFWKLMIWNKTNPSNRYIIQNLACGIISVITMDMPLETKNNYSVITIRSITHLLGVVGLIKYHFKSFGKSWRALGMLNSSPPSAAYMRQGIGSALVQILACRLFGAKSLSERVLAYCQFDPWDQTTVKFESKYKTFHSRNAFEKNCLLKWRPFCSGVDGLIVICYV